MKFGLFTIVPWHESQTAEQALVQQLELGARQIDVAAADPKVRRNFASHAGDRHLVHELRAWCRARATAQSLGERRLDARSPP
mgnify:CR=1 FL=1